MADDIWIVAWRIRGRDKTQSFDSKADATDLIRQLLASDADMLSLSRVPVVITVKVTTAKPVAAAE